MQRVYVKDKTEGIEKAKETLYKKVDRQTLLFLSGGQSPKPLYESLSREKKLLPGAVAIIDERQGEPMHKNSNEKMIKETGLLDYFKARNIPWYPMLQKGLSREKTAEAYEGVLGRLFDQFRKSVAIVSIGADGHTAGIAPIDKEIKVPNEPKETSNHFSLQMPMRLSRSGNDRLVGEYNDVSGHFGERITLTFAGLEKMDYFILWVFGNEKKEALQKIFEKREASSVNLRHELRSNERKEKAIPGRFYTRPEISERTILLTDQKI